MSQAKTLSHVIGERMRQAREATNLPQEHIASTARRRYGLRWTRATVAAIESGKREITLGEFIMLPMIMSFSHCHFPGEDNKFFELQDLIPSDGWLPISPETSVHAEFVSAVLRGKAGDDTFPGLLNTPELRKVRALLPKIQERMRERAEEYDRLKKLWPEVVKKPDLMRIDDEVFKDAVKKVALKLRISPLAVAFASHALWGKGFEEERDSRVSERAKDDVLRMKQSLLGKNQYQRTTQAMRGHVTRALLREIKSALDSRVTAQP
jgi:hypothetical protein